jgi:hypothetical protein
MAPQMRHVINTVPDIMLRVATLIQRGSFGLAYTGANHSSLPNNKIPRSVAKTYTGWRMPVGTVPSRVNEDLCSSRSDSMVFRVSIRTESAKRTIHFACAMVFTSRRSSFVT